MAVSITTYGAVFIGVCSLLLIARPHWLVAIFPLAAVMQTPAVALIAAHNETLGMSSVLAWAAFAGIYVVITFSRGGVSLWRASSRNFVLLGWLVFLGFCCITSLVLPNLFEGLSMHVLIDFDGDNIPPRPLFFNLNHWVQIANAGAIALVFLLLFKHSWSVSPISSLQIFFAGMCAAVGISVLVTSYHRLVALGYVEFLPGMWESNPSYKLNFGPTSVSDNLFVRASLPFSEPSYASVWYGSLALGCWLTWLLSKRGSTKYMPAGAIVSCALLSTWGYTGLLGVGITFMVVLLSITFTYAIGRSPCGITTVALRHRVVVGWTSLMALVAVVVAVFFFSPHSVRTVAKESVAGIIKRVSTVANQGDGKIIVGRQASNTQALQIVRATHGLGVGMGSNRASGYFHALLSNVGIIGTLLFMFAFGIQARTAWRNSCQLNQSTRNTDQTLASIGIFSIGALACATVAVAGGIPDQNWPVFWVFIALVFSVAQLRPPRAL
jgi:hypothetical protein